jgi:hypothetical protein
LIRWSVVAHVVGKCGGTEVVDRTRSRPPAAADYRHDDGVKSPPPERRWRGRIDGKLAGASVAIAVGLVLIGYAVARSVTGDEVTHLPAAIERISPVPDAVQVLAQSQVVVDLAEGFEGRMTVDGVEFPTQRMEDLTNDNVEPGTQVEIPPGVVLEPGNDTLTFTPGPGIDVEKFDDGVHRVTVIYWPTERGEGAARSYSWSFTVV